MSPGIRILVGGNVPTGVGEVKGILVGTIVADSIGVTVNTEVEVERMGTDNVDTDATTEVGGIVTVTVDVGLAATRTQGRADSTVSTIAIPKTCIKPLPP